MTVPVGQHTSNMQPFICVLTTVLSSSKGACIQQLPNISIKLWRIKCIERTIRQITVLNFDIQISADIVLEQTISISRLMFAVGVSRPKTTYKPSNNNQGWHAYSGIDSFDFALDLSYSANYEQERALPITFTC